MAYISYNKHILFLYYSLLNFRDHARSLPGSNMAAHGRADRNMLSIFLNYDGNGDNDNIIQDDDCDWDVGAADPASDGDEEALDSEESSGNPLREAPGSILSIAQNVNKHKRKNLGCGCKHES